MSQRENGSSSPIFGGEHKKKLDEIDECSKNTRIGVSLNGGTPKTPQVLIIFSRENPMGLLGKPTILGTPHIYQRWFPTWSISPYVLKCSHRVTKNTPPCIPVYFISDRKNHFSKHHGGGHLSPSPWRQLGKTAPDSWVIGWNYAIPPVPAGKVRQVHPAKQTTMVKET